MAPVRPGLNAPSGAGCFLTGGANPRKGVVCKSQCTFWCWVLSDKKWWVSAVGIMVGLNAPSGAGCFLTPLPLGAASLRHFRGLERHRLRKHPAGPAGTVPI